jgi:hypothetical protein
MGVCPGVWARGYALEEGLADRVLGLLVSGAWRIHRWEKAPMWDDTKDVGESRFGSKPDSRDQEVFLRRYNGGVAEP